MTYTDERLRELAEKRYGTDIHLFAQQRDGFIEGYKEALKQVRDIAYEPVLAPVFKTSAFSLDKIDNDGDFEATVAEEHIGYINKEEAKGLADFIYNCLNRG